MVRELFQSNIELAVDDLMAMKEYYVMKKTASSPALENDFLCYTLDEDLSFIPVTLLSLNASSTTLYSLDLFAPMARVLGLQRGIMEVKLANGIKEELKAELNMTWFNESSCPQKESHHLLKAKTITLIFFYYCQVFPIPLGSLLYDVNYHSDPYFKILKSIKLKKDGASVSDVFARVNHVRITDNGFCCSLKKRKFGFEVDDDGCNPCNKKVQAHINSSNVIVSGEELKNIRKILSWGVTPFTNDIERQKLMRQFAYNVTDILGMTEDVLLKEEDVGQYPAKMWLCQTNKLKTIPCPSVGFSHADNGHAFTLNGGNWADIFTVNGEGLNIGWSGEVVSLKEDLTLFVDNVDGPYMEHFIFCFLFKVFSGYKWLFMHKIFFPPILMQYNLTLATHTPSP